MLLTVFCMAVSAAQRRNKTESLLESRPSAYDRMITRFSGEDRALKEAAKTIPKSARMFEPIIEMPPARPPMDMMVPSDPKKPRVSVMYPRYCCSCRLTKNVSANDPIIQNWASTANRQSFLHRIEKLQSLGARQEQVEQYLKELENKVKRPSSASSSRKHSTTKHIRHRRSTTRHPKVRSVQRHSR